MMRDEILDVLARMGALGLREIAENTGCTVGDIAPLVERLVQRGDLVMKEDTIDHEWTYRNAR